MKRAYADEIADAMYNLAGVEKRLRVVDNPELRLRECQRLEARAQELLDLAKRRRDELTEETAKRPQLVARAYELATYITLLRKLVGKNAPIPNDSFASIRRYVNRMVSQMSLDDERW